MVMIGFYHRGGWQLDMAEFSGAFSSRTKAVILNTPHNPTGKVVFAPSDSFKVMLWGHDYIEPSLFFSMAMVVTSLTQIHSALCSIARTTTQTYSQ